VRQCLLARKLDLKGGIKDHQMKHMVKISEDKFAVRPHIRQKHPINLATQ
jgi:hypothetical protein